MRRLEPLMLGMMTLILGICIWTGPVAAQTCRDPISSAAGEPTDPERIHTGYSRMLEPSSGGAVQSTPGTQAPVLSKATFTQKLEAFFTLLRRYGFDIPRGHRS